MLPVEPIQIDIAALHAAMLRYSCDGNAEYAFMSLFASPNGAVTRDAYLADVIDTTLFKEQAKRLV